MTAEETSRYFEEVGRALRQGGFEVGGVDDDHGNQFLVSGSCDGLIGNIKNDSIASFHP